MLGLHLSTELLLRICFISTGIAREAPQKKDSTPADAVGLDKQQSAYQMYPILNIYPSFPNTHTCSFSLSKTCNLGCLPTHDPLASTSRVLRSQEWTPHIRLPKLFLTDCAPGSNERPHIACGHYNSYTSVWFVCKVGKNCTSKSISLNGRTLRVRLLRSPKRV